MGLYTRRPSSRRRPLPTTVCDDGRCSRIIATQLHNKESKTIKLGARFHHAATLAVVMYDMIHFGFQVYSPYDIVRIRTRIAFSAKLTPNVKPSLFLYILCEGMVCLYQEEAHGMISSKESRGVFCCQLGAVIYLVTAKS